MAKKFKPISPIGYKGWHVSEMKRQVGDFIVEVNLPGEEYPDQVSWIVWDLHNNYISLDEDGSPGIVRIFGTVDQAVRAALACAKEANKMKTVRCEACSGKGHITHKKEKP